MKHLLLTTIAAVLVVGCGESQQPEPPTAKAPDISIHEAANEGNIEAVKQHLAAGTNVNAKRGRGWTPLHDTNNKKIIELLITKGADVNSKCDNGQTPLHNAATVPNISKAELLIANGADVNAMLYNPQGEGGTAMDLCINLRNVSTVNMQKILPPDGMPQLDENNILTDGYKRFADLLRKHGGKTGEELKAEGK